MKVLFLITAFNSKVRYHPGLASLSAVLKKGGHKTGLLSVNSLDLAYIRDFVRRFSPDIIAASANSHQYYYMKKIIPAIREDNKSVKIILGGVHSTLDGNVINEVIGLNAACRGEGEMPLLAYADALNMNKEDDDIPNMLFRKDDTIKENKITYYVKDLDSLPYPDYSIFPSLKERDSDSSMRFLFNRGCPFNCSYCCNHRFKSLFPDKKEYVRFKSPKRVADELLYFSDAHDFSHYVIDDDVFTLNKKWLLEFCSVYPERLKSKTFEINIRVETVDREMLAALKEIGCSLIKIGIESGSESVRREILCREISQDKIIETAALVRRLGLKLHTFNMIGVPNETRRDVWKTIGINRKIQPDKVQITIFYPYKNTRLGDYCINNNLIKRERSDSYFTESILKTNPLCLSRAEISHYSKMFKFYVYAGKNNKIAASFLKSLLAKYLRLSLRGAKRRSNLKRGIASLTSFARNDILAKGAFLKFMEEKIIRLNNKAASPLKMLYLLMRRPIRNPMWEGEFVDRAYLGELKPILDREVYTEHGILNTEAFLIYSLLRKETPDTVIESGTYKGYSSLFIAEALRMNKKGKFITISLDKDDCIRLARERLLAYPFADIIEGESQKVLKEGFDKVAKEDKITVFIDGPKGSAREFDELIYLLKKKIDEGYGITDILIHDCEEHIPLFFNKGAIDGYINPTRLKAEYFYKRYFSKNYTLRFMTNEYYERHRSLDRSIFTKPDTDIVPYNFKMGRQPSYGTSIALIRKR